MKIWPFDQFGPATNGQQISAEEIERGCEPFEKIRKAVGNRIEIALEMHSVWGLPAAQRIARAVEQYDPLWFEDPVRMDNLDALLQFRAERPASRPRPARRCRRAGSSARRSRRARSRS